MNIIAASVANLLLVKLPSLFLEMSFIVTCFSKEHNYFCEDFRAQEIHYQDKILLFFPQI